MPHPRELPALRDFSTTFSYVCAIQSFEASSTGTQKGYLQSKAMADMSEKHSDTTQSINSSKPSTIIHSPEANHDPNLTTDATISQVPLSSHWEEFTDSDGRTFYANHATRSTSWRRADAEIEGDGSDIQAGLPPAWQEPIDSDGRTYYANHESRTTTFDRPEGLVGVLPAGWELLRNTEGLAYFADHNTHTTTWRNPNDGVFEGSDVEVVGVERCV